MLLLTKIQIILNQKNKKKEESYQRVEMMFVPIV